MNRWSWLCPWLAAAVFVLFELTWWSALLAALLLVCPALMLWGLFVITRPKSDEPAVHTLGMTMDWAALFYDVYCRAAGLGQGFRDQMLQVAAIRAGEAILYVGCGTGVLTRRAAEAAGAAGSAIGIDPGQDMIRVAKEKCAAARQPRRVQGRRNQTIAFRERAFRCRPVQPRAAPPAARLETAGLARGASRAQAGRPLHRGGFLPPRDSGVLECQQTLAACRT